MTTAQLAQRKPPLADKKRRLARNRRFRALGLPYKACGKCFRVKPYSAFPLDRSKPDGRLTRCAACHRATQAERLSDPAVRAVKYAQVAEYQRRHRAEYVSRQKDLGDSHLPKRCTTTAAGGCGRLLTRYEFNRDRSRADFREPWCRDCKMHKDAERYLLRKLDLLNYWDEIGALAGCYLCLRPFTNEITLHIEHVLPKALGGSDDRENLMPACADCNLAKSAADPWDYLPTALAAVGIDFHAAYRAKP